MSILRLLLISSMMCLAYNSIAAQAKDEPTSTVLKERKTHSVFKGVLYRVWGRLRALNPKVNAKEAARKQTVATAGIRGEQSTETTLKPYWKDDRTNDPQYRKALQAFNDAQLLVDQGELEKGLTALADFAKNYPDNDLQPNALFTKGLVLAGQGETAASQKIFKRFIKENPQHPLKEDAKAVLSELDKS